MNAYDETFYRYFSIPGSPLCAKCRCCRYRLFTCWIASTLCVGESRNIIFRYQAFFGRQSYIAFWKYHPEIGLLMCCLRYAFCPVRPVSMWIFCWLVVLTFHFALFRLFLIRVSLRCAILYVRSNPVVPFFFPQALVFEVTSLCNLVWLDKLRFGLHLLGALLSIDRKGQIFVYHQNYRILVGIRVCVILGFRWLEWKVRC